MNASNRKEHWERIYRTKSPHEFSWYQPTPEISLGLMKQFNLPLTAKIIDIGGGDSLFADHLLALGYQDITILDISEEAIQKARKRLGDQAARVHWIVTDVIHFKPEHQYDFWHDRATFHFLLDQQEIDRYLQTAAQSLASKGIMVLGTFAEDGPLTCSGLPIQRYSEAWMTERLRSYFQKIKCIHADHLTPSKVIQHFVFCSFRKEDAA